MSGPGCNSPGPFRGSFSGYGVIRAGPRFRAEKLTDVKATSRRPQARSFHCSGMLGWGRYTLCKGSDPLPFSEPRCKQLAGVRLACHQASLAVLLVLLLLPRLKCGASRKRSALCRCPYPYTRSREPHRRSRRALRRRAPCCSKGPGPLVGWLRALSCVLAHSSGECTSSLICLMYALRALLQTRFKSLKVRLLDRVQACPLGAAVGKCRGPGCISPGLLCVLVSGYRSTRGGPTFPSGEAN